MHSHMVLQVTLNGWHEALRISTASAEECCNAVGCYSLIKSSNFDTAEWTTFSSTTIFDVSCCCCILIKGLWQRWWHAERNNMPGDEKAQKTERVTSMVKGRKREEQSESPLLFNILGQMGSVWRPLAQTWPLPSRKLCSLGISLELNLPFLIFACHYDSIWFKFTCQWFKFTKIHLNVFHP